MLSVLYDTKYEAARKALSGLSTSATPETQLNALRDRWVKRLKELRAAGWPAIEKEHSFNMTCMCPPFGVITDMMGRLHPCNKILVCPFCYARRRVIASLGRFESVARLGCWREYVWTAAERVCETGGVPVKGHGGFCGWLRSALTADRKLSRNAFDGACGFVQYAVKLQGDDNSVVLRRSCVLLSSKRSASSYLRDDGWAVSHGSVALDDCHGLVEAVGKVWSYPEESLTSDARRFVELCDGLRHCQFSTPFGWSSLWRLLAKKRFLTSDTAPDL